MKLLTLIVVSYIIFLFTHVGISQNRYTDLAQTILLSVKYDEDCTAKLDSLATVSFTTLVQELKTDDLKKAFWLNIYNASVQLELSKSPDKYKNRKSFYRAKFIIVACKRLSLDDVEHGMIRHSKNKLALGYLNTVFNSSFEKQLRITKLDNRIHFALNCGAKSCPPILYYDANNIDTQLTEATTGYLSAECALTNETVNVPVLFSWFRGDFGGKRKIISYLKQYGAIKHDRAIKHVRFLKYNWDLALKQYK